MINESKPNLNDARVDMAANTKATFLGKSGWPNTVKDNFKLFLNLIVDFIC